MTKAFSMIELIFIIVIVGILSAIAIPKLMATRDDAKISKMALAIQAVHSEIAASVVATNKIPSTNEDIEKISNTVLEQSPHYSIVINHGQIIEFIDSNHNNEVCKVLTIDDSNLSQVSLRFTDGAGESAMCKGVQKLVPNTSSGFTIAGNIVNY